MRLVYHDLKSFGKHLAFSHDKMYD